jgi:pseudouridine-5'-phosphate glycosidase
MPYPQNVETAMLVEETVRETGAIPATIAIISGQLKAGLNADEIDLLGKTGTAVNKVSRRDLPYVVSQGLHGATTVAATMIIAEMASIRIFATGGIGGVHRGAANSMDISADLQELARTSVAVVSAGAKSILDLTLTLEYLETMGVPVLGYQTDEFPAFFTRKSGLPVDFRLDTPLEIAQLLRTKWDLGLKGGALIANPIPPEHEVEYGMIQEAIEQALAEADQKGIKGKAITPYLLARIEQLTQGQSLKANIQLVLNNARLAAKIARALVG